MSAGVALGAPDDRLPDLVADPPGDPYLEAYGGTGRDRRRLRFDGYLHNVGARAPEMRGNERRGTTTPDACCGARRGRPRWRRPRSSASVSRTWTIPPGVY